MDQQRILEKIKKCFALSKSSNANEAAIALKQAYALARQYGIEHMELLTQISNSDLIRVSRTTDRLDYKLMDLIEDIFNVSTVINTSGVKKKVRFFGNANDVIIAGYIFEVLSRLLKKARTEFLKNHTDNRMKKETKTRRAELFSRAWIEAIEEEVLKFKAEDSEYPEGHSQAIAEYKKNFYGRELENAKMNSKVHDYKEADYSAYSRGKTEGSKVKINNAVRNKDQKLQLK